MSLTNKPDSYNITKVDLEAYITSLGISDEVVMDGRDVNATGQIPNGVTKLVSADDNLVAPAKIILPSDAPAGSKFVIEHTGADYLIKASCLTILFDYRVTDSNHGIVAFFLGGTWRILN